MDIKINVSKLREDLINYFGAVSVYNELARIYLMKSETITDEELIKIALANNFDLVEYQVPKHL